MGLTMNNINVEEFEYQMNTVGFSIFEDFITEETCDNLKKKVTMEIENYQESGNNRIHLDRCHLHDLVCKHIDVAKLLESDELDKLLSLLLGDTWIMYAFTSSSCPPKSTNYGGRVHVDSPRWINGYPTNIGVIWAIDNFTIDNGATKVLVASQHSEKMPTKKFFNENAQQVVCPKGSLIIFNSRVVHSSGNNNTDEWRHALTMNACRSYMKQRMDWVRFIPDTIAKDLNETAKRIIGYDTRLPSNLEEFFLPDEQRLYKPNQG